MVTERQVTDLKSGDLIDLTSCPFMKDHPSAVYQYAEVINIETETPTCIVVYYEEIGPVGYSPSQKLVIKS